MYPNTPAHVDEVEFSCSLEMSSVAVVRTWRLAFFVVLCEEVYVVVCVCVCVHVCQCVRVCLNTCYTSKIHMCIYVST